MRPVKITLFKAAILLLLLSILGAVMWFGFPLYVWAKATKALSTVASHQDEITSVEVLRLSGKGKSGPEGTYFLRYDRSYNPVSVRRTFSGAEAGEIVKAWGRIRFVEGIIAMCHEPGYVLRFFADKRCVFEVAVCFECENVSYVPVPFAVELRQMAPASFDPKSDLKGLKSLLERLFDMRSLGLAIPPAHQCTVTQCEKPAV